MPTTIVEVRAFPLILGDPRSRPEIISTYLTSSTLSAISRVYDPAAHPHRAIVRLGRQYIMSPGHVIWPELKTTVA